MDQLPHALPISTNTKNCVKRSSTTESGYFAQIVEIEVGKSKKLFAEKWSGEKRLCRIALSEKVEAVPKDDRISGGINPDSTGSYLVFAAQATPKTNVSYFEKISSKERIEN